MKKMEKERDEGAKAVRSFPYIRDERPAASPV